MENSMAAGVGDWATVEGSGATVDRVWWSRVFIIGVLLLSGVPRPGGAQSFTDPRFTSEVVATFAPFSLVGMRWAPDGRLFVWQKNGVVRVIKNGALLPTPFIDLSAHVNTFDDRGMWGLAFHPDFVNNGHVFLTYVHEPAGDPNDAGSKTARLVRVTADPANPDRALVESETILLTVPNFSGTHTLGALRFAPDGKMFVASGDGADASGVDPNSMGAQDLSSLRGKILRINEDGSAPGDNPFDDGTNSDRSKIWALGIRNPFSFHLHPSTGEPYFADVGWNTWEEINRPVRGGNYGWPCYEGNGPQSAYRSAFPECAELTGVTSPLFTYDHSVGSAAIGGGVYTGSAYPQEYVGNLFFADYPGSWIRRIVFDAAGAVSSVQYFATDVQNPVAMEQGPDGMLYYHSFSTGQLRRIRYNGPKAVAAAAPRWGDSPLSVNFSSVGSASADGSALSYLWNFGDGTTSTEANPVHSYVSGSVRSFTATLTVTATNGQTASASVLITINSTPPVPVIQTPQDGTLVRPGQVVTYQGSATDPDEILAPTALRWTVLLHHNTHVHTFIGSTGTGGSFEAEFHGVGTYAYEVMLAATDSSGLSTSVSVLLPVVPDTAGPTVPGNVSAQVVGSNQIDLAWDASTDDVRVENYQVERCQGAACTGFSLVSTLSGPSFSDPVLTAGTTYRYRVRAVDPSGNVSAYSAIVAATTAGTAPPPSLVAAYGFNEGSGSAVADASGNGNTGTVSGATWTTQGRFGRALNFDGSASLVVIPGSSSLNSASGLTLEAWVNPATSQGGWRTIVQREVDAYFLNASTSAGPLRPGGGGTINGGVSVVTGPGAIPAGSWTHVALTHDGAVLTLYVNGASVASQAAAGTLQTNTNPLRIGGNVPYGEFFQGTIDEVRVYNRALSAAEIQADMMMGVGGGSAADTTPPTAPATLTAATVSSTRVDVSWSAATDNVGVTAYRVERCTGSGCTSFTEVATPATLTFSDGGRTAATTYLYRVRAVDAAGNLGPYSPVATATTPAAPDTTAPTAPATLTATAVSATRIDLSWSAATDNVGVTGYRVQRCTGVTCTNFTQIATPATTTFSDSGRAPSTTYRYRVRAVDAAGNLGSYSPITPVTTPADTTPPTAPATLTATVISSTRIDLTWSAASDNVAVTGYRVERCSGSTCTNFAQIATRTPLNFANTGLAPGTTYRYRVRAADAAGNLGLYSPIATATTTDPTPPSAPATLNATAVSAVQIDLSWTPAADNVGVTGYRVERCTGSGCTTFAEISAPTTTAFSDGARTASTTYRYRVRAADAAGNLGAYSPIATATTPAVADLTPPTAPAALTATPVAATRIDLSWSAATDNVGLSGYSLERCAGSGCTTFAQIATPTTLTFSDSGPVASTTYRYRVRAMDTSGNLGPYSPIATATTPSGPAAPPGLVAAYGFNEGSGTTVADASGNANTGTISGAAWTTQGRYGQALSFDGSSSLVAIAGTAALNLTAGMTLEAWINPSATQGGWRTIMQREVDAYFLNASTSAGPLRPGGGGTIAGGISVVTGPTASPLGGWTHVALTYNGATLTLYVNGTAVASQAATGPLQTNANPLRIGGNVPYGEFFHGVIDEVRVYNRALSAAEIQADMVTPLP
jgi:glucose/arabinose dehydrogenase/predicted phage tail protein